jgi:hypothetical protein
MRRSLRGSTHRAGNAETWREASMKPKKNGKVSASSKRAQRPDGGAAFLPEPGEHRSAKPDDLAEELGEQFLLSATSGEESAEDAFNASVVEEIGGPFIPSSMKKEAAEGTDESNPEDAQPEPFPSPMRARERWH